MLYRDVALRSGGTVEDADGIVLITGSHPSPVIANVGFRPPASSAASSMIADQVIDRIGQHFARVRHGASLLTSKAHDADIEAAAERAGWQAVVQLPVMLADAPVGERPVDDVSLGWVDPERDVGAFREVLANGFAEDDDERGMVRALFGPSTSLAPPGLRAVLARVDGEVVGAGAAYLFGETAVVGWITVLESHRRRGIGTRITAALTDAAFDEGATVVALQASPMGAPVYERMGFQVVGRDIFWLPPTTPETAG